jgi:hypothetical protein
VRNPSNLTRIINLPSVSGLLDNSAGRILWHSELETSGVNPATFRLWDGSGTGSKLLMAVSLTAGQSTRDNFARPYLAYQGGMYYELVTGAIQGSLVIIPWHVWEDDGMRALVLGENIYINVEGSET